MRLTTMLDFWLWSSWLTIKKLVPKINIFYRPSGGQIAKNLVGGVVFRSEKKLHGPAARLLNIPNILRSIRGVLTLFPKS